MGQGAEDADSMSDDGAEDWCKEKDRQDRIDHRERMRKHNYFVKNLKLQLKKEILRDLNLSPVQRIPPKPKMVKVSCKNCHNEFESRVADRKRGWGKFCSKSCAAKHKDRVNGGIYRGEYGT